MNTKSEVVGQGSDPAAPQKPVASFVAGAKRSETVKLEYPIEFDGTVWDQIEVRRMTSKEIRSYFEAQETDPTVPFPMFDAPREVMDNLDADDDFAVQKVAQRFLPRSFQAPPET